MNDENLRARINALEYELKNIQQERNVVKLQHEKELRDVQAKADADFKKYQAAQSASGKATSKHDALARELREVKDQSINEKASLEKQLRDLRDQNSSLKDDAQDAQAQLSDQGRQYDHRVKDIEDARKTLQHTVGNLQQELDRLSQEHDAVQARLAKRDVEAEALEAQVEELKSHTGDSDALAVVQRELSDQVTHIRQLETTNREHFSELRRLREGQKSVHVVEEQKRALETQLEVLKDVHRQLGEAQIQKEMLEDEKRTWTSLLERENEQPEFDSPEDVVKALVQERLQHASLVEQLGTTQAEASEKDELIKSVESQKADLTKQLEAKINGAQAEAGIDGKAYKRLDRQRALAVKEVEYLRAQLKTFDTEETVLMENQNYDRQRSEHVQHLESLVDDYKSEIQTLNTQLSTQEQSQPRGTKRRAESQDPDDDSGANTNTQIGPLLRKNKNLQIALQKTTQQSQLLATELQAAKSQLKSLRSSKSTRILELRDNPTAQHEAIKQSTLTTLKSENADLLSQLRGENLQKVKMVPVSTLDALTLDLTSMKAIVAEKEKRMRRQREIWTDKAAEFRDAIASLLGYRVNFMPNGKVKISSLFYRPASSSGDAPADADGDDDVATIDEENHILFDGDKGTMKISGGPAGAFGKDVKELVEFWVKDKKEIPCLMAAMTLEFYEKFGGGPGAGG